LRDGGSLSLDDLKTFLLAKEIAKYKLPERLEVFSDLPLSVFGKVSKQQLVEMVSARTAAD
jgi:2,3-dihydroxybenzoate-AMP ligase